MKFLYAIISFIFLFTITATTRGEIINIFDVRGNLVCRLNLGYQETGFHMERGNAAYWDGRDSSGQRVASGNCIEGVGITATFALL